MSRPSDTHTAKPQPLPVPGVLKVQPPSLTDIGSDLKATLLPILQLGLTVSRGLLRGSLRVLLSDPTAALSQGATEDVKSAITSVREILAAIGSEDSAERRLWQLIRNALIQALANLIDDQSHLLQPGDAPSLVLEFAAEEITTEPIVVDASFLNSPRKILRQLGIRDAIGRSLASAYRLPTSQNEFLLAQLDGLFDLAMWAEHNKHADYYKPVLEALDSRFAGPARWHAANAEHRIKLKALSQAPVLGAPFMLKDIYVNLRAAMWIPPKENSPGHFSVVPANEYLEQWAKAPFQGPGYCIRFVSGGPGTGKSSLAATLLSSLADQSDIFPVYIRLLDFKIDDTGIEPALQNYLHRFYPYLPSTPWSDTAKDVFAYKTILLVLDGLDELSKALGSRGQSRSKALVGSLLKFIEDRNPSAAQHGTTIKAIVIGRTVAIEELRHGRAERWDSNEVILLGLDAGKKLNMAFAGSANVIDAGNLLDMDLRHEWWSKYSTLMKDSDAFPRILDEHGIVELSREPLTLFLLVAAKYHLKPPEVIRGGAAIAQIYRDILRGLYERDMERRAHAGQIQMSFEHFFRALQVIGFAAWYSTERSTTRKQLISVLDSVLTQDRPIFDQFERDIDEGAMKLLLAAHVHLKNDGATGGEDAAYEFSHKSFGEFLAAECLWRQLCSISAPFIRRELNISYTAQRVVDLLWNSQATSDFSRFLHSIATLCSPACETVPVSGSSKAHDAHLLCLHDEFLMFVIRMAFGEGFSLANHSQLAFGEAAAKHRSTASALWQIRSAVVKALSPSAQHRLRTAADGINRRILETVPEVQELRCWELHDAPQGGLQAVNCDFVALSYGFFNHNRLINCLFSSTRTHLYAMMNSLFEDCAFEELEFSVLPAPLRRAKAEDRSGEAIILRTLHSVASRDLGAIAAVNFHNCEFRKVTIEGAVILEAEFLNCRFSEVTFRRCVIFTEYVRLASPNVFLDACTLIDEKLQVKSFSGRADIRGKRSSPDDPSRLP